MNFTTHTLSPNMESPTSAARKRHASSHPGSPGAPAPKSVKVEHRFQEDDSDEHAVDGAHLLSTADDSIKSLSKGTQEDVFTKPFAVGERQGVNSRQNDMHVTKRTGRLDSTHQLMSNQKVKRAPIQRESPQREEFSTSTSQLMVREHVGDLFTAPDNVVIAHACNTVGSWGGGIAVEFRKRYPNAFKIYNKYCTVDHDPKNNRALRGTCLLIPPCEDAADAPKHWIGCLFTSAKYGKAKDPPNIILHHTSGAVKDLFSQLLQEPAVTEVRMCQINAGLFAVPWKDTKKVLEDVSTTAGNIKEVHVYSLNLNTSAPLNSGGIHKPAKGSLKRPPSKGQSTLHSFITSKQPGRKK